MLKWGPSGHAFSYYVSDFNDVSPWHWLLKLPSLWQPSVKWQLQICFQDCRTCHNLAPVIYVTSRTLWCRVLDYTDLWHHEQELCTVQVEGSCCEIQSWSPDLPTSCSTCSTIIGTHHHCLVLVPAWSLEIWAQWTLRALFRDGSKPQLTSKSVHWKKS